MTFVIDITRSVSRAMQGKFPTGVDRLGLAYIEHFAKNSLGLVRYGRRWVILSKADSKRIFKALLKPGKNFAWLARYLVGKNYALNWSRKSDASILLNVVHNGLEEPTYAKQIEKRKLKPIFFLHDIIPITHPEYCRPGDMEKHQRRLATIFSTGSGLLFNSLDSQREISAYAAANNYTLPHWICAPIAMPISSSPLAQRPLTKPYFVVLSTIEARKNHLLLLNIWRELAMQFGADTPQLIIIGRRGWECEQVVDMLERCQQIQGLVTEKPDCNDTELATWLAHAQSLLFPSFAEGYGLPLIEALSLGTPVIASNLAVFKELAGDIPDYVHPLDIITWKQLIIDYMDQESPRANAQRVRMQGYKTVTWEEHFAKVEKFLQDAKI